MIRAGMLTGPPCCLTCLLSITPDNIGSPDWQKNPVFWPCSSVQGGSSAHAPICSLLVKTRIKSDAFHLMVTSHAPMNVQAICRDQ